MARISQEASSPIPQAKLMRVLEFIAVIKGKGKTVGELAAQFNISERSVYRYVRLLEAVGFVIDKNFENRYFIFTSEEEPSANNFSIAETNILKTLIRKGAFDNPMRNSLLKKLSLNSELDDMPNVIVKLKIGQHIEKLTEAIKNKKQVILKGYHSANSNEIKNRLVEPFQFGTDYKSVIALDTHDQKCKQFKLERIDDVADTKKKFKFEALHKKTSADIFGLSGETTTWITLKLTMRSYLLLREEYPLSVHYTERKGSKFLFHGPVTSFEGIGRFVLGLMDHITIKEPKEFKKFIKQKLIAAQQSLK